MSHSPLIGGCSCGRVRYRLKDTPLIVHACHCRMCQRLTGSSNAVSAVIEAELIEHLTGELAETEALTPSGHGLTISRCSVCKVAVWSEYKIMTAKTKADLRFVRAGTLDDPALVPPDVHIYTETMLSYATPTLKAPAFPTFYDLEKTWPSSSLKRLAMARDTPVANGCEKRFRKVEDCSTGLLHGSTALEAHVTSPSPSSAGDQRLSIFDL